MLKNVKIVLAFVLAIALSTTTYVYAEATEEATLVSSYQELVDVAAKKSVTSIKLGADIVVEQPILFLHDIDIDGNNHTLSINKKTDGWDGLYILKLNRIDAKIKDLTLTGGDAAVLVNNSRLTLNGAITLENQAFGGIELTQGKTAKPDPVALHLGDDLVIKNVSEEKGKPTVWTDMITDYEIPVGYFIGRNDIKVGQDQFYISDPEIVHVDSYEGLQKAVNAKAPYIVLDADIEVLEKLNISYPVHIDGNNHTLSANAKAEWEGFYILQFYKTEAFVKDITLTGGNVGMYANGSKVTLEGNVDVSGNGFGGIEVSQGRNVTEVPVLDLTKATLTNDTEDFGHPTVWIDKTEGEVLHDGLNVRTDVKEGQTHFYLNKTTRREQYVTDLVLEVFNELELEGFEVDIDTETREITLRKVDEGAVISEDEIVHSLTTVILSHEDILGFTLNGEEHLEITEEYVEKVVRDMLEVLKEHEETVRESFRDLQVALRFHVQYEDYIVPTEDLDLVYVEKDKQEPKVEPETPGTKEEPKEETKEDPKVTDKDDVKKDKETPKTGLQESVVMYASLITLGALVLVTLENKKRRI